MQLWFCEERSVCQADDSMRSKSNRSCCLMDRFRLRAFSVWSCSKEGSQWWLFYAWLRVAHPSSPHSSDCSDKNITQRYLFALFMSLCERFLSRLESYDYYFMRAIFLIFLLACEKSLLRRPQNMKNAANKCKFPSQHLISVALVVLHVCVFSLSLSAQKTHSLVTASRHTHARTKEWKSCFICRRKNIQTSDELRKLSTKKIKFFLAFPLVLHNEMLL